MTLHEAIELLKREGVSDEFYEVGGGLGSGEIWGIERVGGQWSVYFSERGMKDSVRMFDAEPEAVGYFLAKVKKRVKEFTGNDISIDPNGS